MAKKKSMFENLSKWQNYVHYIALGLLLVVAFHLFGIIGIQYWVKSLWAFPKLALSLLVADTIVHAVFWMLPKPMRWRD